MKKITAFILSVAMLFAMAIPAFAAGEDSEGMTVYFGETKAKSGQSVTLELKVKNNPGFVSLNLAVVCDSPITVSKVENKLNGFTMTTGSSLVWEALESYTKDGTIAIVTFDIPKGIDLDDYEIQIVSFGASTEDFEDFDYSVESGKITVEPLISVESLEKIIGYLNNVFDDVGGVPGTKDTVTQLIEYYVITSLGLDYSEAVKDVWNKWVESDADDSRVFWTETLINLVEEAGLEYGGQKRTVSDLKNALAKIDGNLYVDPKTSPAAVTDAMISKINSAKNASEACEIFQEILDNYNKNAKLKSYAEMEKALQNAVKAAENATGDQKLRDELLHLISECENNMDNFIKGFPVMPKAGFIVYRIVDGHDCFIEDINTNNTIYLNVAAELKEATAKYEETIEKKPVDSENTEKPGTPEKPSGSENTEKPGGNSNIEKPGSNANAENSGDNVNTENPGNTNNGTPAASENPETSVKPDNTADNDMTVWCVLSLVSVGMVALTVKKKVFNK